jgi:hypothetical protein
MYVYMHACMYIVWYLVYRARARNGCMHVFRYVRSVAYDTPGNGQVICIHVFIYLYTFIRMHLVHVIIYLCIYIHTYIRRPGC